MKNKIELYEKNGETWIRGQLTIKDANKKSNSNEIIGVAMEDIKKGQIGIIKI